MYVSKHFAISNKLAAKILKFLKDDAGTGLLASETWLWNVYACLTHDSLFKFSGLVNVEELACTQREDHAFIVLLQLIVDLCCNQGRELSLWEGVIFV